MAGIGFFLPSQSIRLASVDCARFHGVKCCSNSRQRKSPRTPKLLKFSVSGVTELIRLFSPVHQNRTDESNRIIDDVKVSDIDDILMVIKSDFEKAYFVTGVFTSAIYADNCTFEDPTIKFQGRDLYSRNLKLLVPFFESPSIFLKKIEKGINSRTGNIVASWRLRTYLKLPWRPLILIDGSTCYDVDEQLKVIRHVESWDISALEAVGQLFTPGFISSTK